MVLKILGEHPLARDENGRLKSRIGTIFPDNRTIVTLPGIHATQRLAYLEELNRARLDGGLKALARQRQAEIWENAVDLITEDDAILIRPDPEKMQLAFAADELLQELLPKYKIRFLHVLNDKVRNAIKKRGECWRINPLPKSTAEMKQMIVASRIGIAGKEIYYHNRASGTRFLTYHQFSQLGDMKDADLLAHLLEIQEFSSRISPQGSPEVDFFMAAEAFTRGDFAPHYFDTGDPKHTRAIYSKLKQTFHDAVPPEYRKDDPDNVQWRNGMCALLIGEEDEVVSEETLLGLSPEFFMQIQWLPGGRIEDGELIFDPILEQSGGDGNSPEVSRLCDENSRGFIINYVRECGDLEYVNIGRVTQSLSHRPASLGRRDVYIAEVKERNNPKEIVSIIRMLKWGVKEHLSEGKKLLDAIIESEEYTEYVLDRRLGCRQLGMNLPARASAKKISETYTGGREEHNGTTIWSPYIEREYIRGIATDKIPSHRFQNHVFALECVRLLGKAAASNLILGRCDTNRNVLFDDGDEVLVEDQRGTPAKIVVADQTGTFADYDRDLQAVAAEYAGPINRRAGYVSDPRRFASAYLDAFALQFSSIQQEYRRRRTVFDTLFNHRRRDEAGSLAYRWEQVLKRLGRTDARELKELIRENLMVT